MFSKFSIEDTLDRYIDHCSRKLHLPQWGVPHSEDQSPWKWSKNISFLKHVKCEFNSNLLSHKIKISGATHSRALLTVIHLVAVKNTIINISHFFF